MFMVERKNSKKHCLTTLGHVSQNNLENAQKEAKQRLMSKFAQFANY